MSRENIYSGSMQQSLLPLLCFTFLSMAWMIKTADNTKLEVIAIMLDDRHQMQIKQRISDVL